MTSEGVVNQSSKVRGARPRGAWLVFAFGMISAALLGACSLVVQRDVTQCQIDGDCARVRVGSVCVASVCVLPTDDAGGEGGALDTAGDAVKPDVGPELGPADCYPQKPTSNGQILNACTGAHCIPFDNCTRLKLCGDASVPGLIDPRDATPADTATTAADGAAG
jgi:hypothetical protein